MTNGSDENDQTSQLSSSPTQSMAASPRQSLFSSTPEKDKRRRSSSWQTKLERRRRKNSTNPSNITIIINDGTGSTDDLNGDSINSNPDSPPVEYNRQKRHSWWNIFVPDNIKQR